MEKTITLEHIKNLSIEDITRLYRQGYSIEGTQNTGCSSCGQNKMIIVPTGITLQGTIQGLAGNCGNIVQGTSKNLNVSVTTAGTPPYTFKIYRASGTNATTGFAQIESTYVGGTSETSHSFSHVFNESVGSYTFRGEITDSCSTGVKMVNSDCNVTITTVISCTNPMVAMTIT